MIPPEGYKKAAADILSDVGLLGAKPASTPVPKRLKLTADDGNLFPEPKKYRRLVGIMLYLNMTRPDITFAVQQHSQFMSKPTQSHWDASIHVLRYLKHAPSTGLFFSSSNDFKLTAYCDSDWQHAQIPGVPSQDTVCSSVPR
ncbi:uncharacterized protein LOC110811191 isoform X1 [Carica papaya]|uniref:uncharacterized protein LOC110811191 isoform X1 n=1 Tax=Carica papaya TaxID=3649 RepID=UPI000B8D10FD|nr:uncharacterized protein LOC110811191 isoform X1 [Carica papaya]